MRTRPVQVALDSIYCIGQFFDLTGVIHDVPHNYSDHRNRGLVVTRCVGFRKTERVDQRDLLDPAA